MADTPTPPVADPKADGSSDQGKPTEQLKDKGATKGQPDTNQDKDISENERLRGQISSLTKKTEEQGQFISKLQGLFSPEDDGKKSSLDEILAKATDRIAELESKNKRAEARELKAQVIDALTDEKGEPISDKVKAYLRDDLDVDEPDEAKIRELAIKKAKTLSSYFGDRIHPKDGAPSSKGAAINTGEKRDAQYWLDKAKEK